MISIGQYAHLLSHVISYYRIAGIYHESFKFANFANFNAFAKLKLAHDFYSYCFTRSLLHVQPLRFLLCQSLF